ncbi:MAG: translation initiation factor [Chitinophagaceae bacterium]|nr:translation initiation factor [Chitinophagaceae bacterium]
MSKKNKPDSRGFVFSTDPDFHFEEQERVQQDTLPPAQQNLRVKLETKHRAGKTVTLVDGFAGTDDDAEKLGKQLKNFCGTGGSVKDGEIIVQGDQRDKVLQFLLKNGYGKTKKSG